MNSTQNETSAKPTPSLPQLLLYLLLLGWLAATPLGVGLLNLLLPPAWSAPAALIFLAALLLLPLALLAALVYRRWPHLEPFFLLLLLTSLYLLLAVIIRAISVPGSGLETFLRFTLLLFAALFLGGLALRRAGLPGSGLKPAFGFNLPAPAGLLAALALIALLTLGWPLTGALGDRWQSGLILLQILAQVLPEEILFRGALLGLLLFTFPHRRGLAVLVALLTYVAFTPTMLLPDYDWSRLLVVLTALPFALLLIELRLSTGSLWAGLLLAWAYRAAPLLFTDPRVELPLLTQPWQTVSHLWMLLAAAIAALALILWRRWLAPRWPLSPLHRLGLAALLTLLALAAWLGLWFQWGHPGFHNDGFLIIMAEQADLSGAEQIEDLQARRAFVRARLLETAAATQTPVREALAAANLDHRPFYLINMIEVKGHHRRMAEFASLPGVARVMLNPNVRPYSFQVSVGYGPASPADPGPPWNIRQTQADQVWDMGITGQGIVVAGQDTGYDWQHPALDQAYRGYNPSGPPTHDYNWHDAWSEAPAPFDDDQHGTHTMGTILGDDGQGNQIGLAPGAVWIGCRNMRRGLGNPASYTGCMEFFLAPYPLGGDPFAAGDVTRAPHLVNNSWGCPDIEGCDDDVLQPATAALRAAGLMMVVSAGNEGPACQTVAEPPARYDNVFSVGALDEQGLITPFSSRGPVPDQADQSPLLKPDIAAPGDQIRSSLPGGGYGLASGTSMAGPHVAGLVALLWSAQPDLIGQIEATEDIIRQSAQPVDVAALCPPELKTPGQSSFMDDLEDLAAGRICACGQLTGSPNNVYGWGQINALQAVNHALNGQ